MGIVYQTDKRSGITYAYENKAYWDKEKKQSRARRKLIGRIDPETGEIVPTDGRGRKASAPAETEPDYKDLYEKLSKKCASQEILIEALREEIRALKQES
jgi:hypothetical protein